VALVRAAATATCHGALLVCRPLRAAVRRLWLAVVHAWRCGCDWRGLVHVRAHAAHTACGLRLHHRRLWPGLLHQHHRAAGRRALQRKLLLLLLEHGLRKLRRRLRRLLHEQLLAVWLHDEVHLLLLLWRRGGGGIKLLLLVLLVVLLRHLWFV
jgi:hypothetical protein